MGQNYELIVPARNLVSENERLGQILGLIVVEARMDGREGIDQA